MNKNVKTTALMAVIIWFAFILNCYANGDNEFICIAKTEFIIGGISCEFSKEQVIAVKGKPNNITINKDLNLEVLKYPDMDIQISNNNILYLVTSMAKNKTPSGISTGMKKSDVMKILGFDNYSDKRSIFQFVNCEYEFYMVFTFDKNDILTSLGMGIDLP